MRSISSYYQLKLFLGESQRIPGHDNNKNGSVFVDVSHGEELRLKIALHSLILFFFFFVASQLLQTPDVCCFRPGTCVYTSIVCCMVAAE